MTLDRHVEVGHEVMFTDPGTGMTFVGVVVYLPEFEKPDKVLVKLEDNVVVSCNKADVKPFPSFDWEKFYRQSASPKFSFLSFKDRHETSGSLRSH